MNTELISCLTCRERVARSRGCCSRCYARHRKAVASGMTSWAELESRGLVTPAQTPAAWRRRHRIPW